MIFENDQKFLEYCARQLTKFTLREQLTKEGAANLIPATIEKNDAKSPLDLIYTMIQYFNEKSLR